MLNSDKNEVLTQFKSEELAGILECLKKYKLTKRFGRLFTLLNRVATDFFDLSPLTGKNLMLHKILHKWKTLNSSFFLNWCNANPN